MSVRALDATLGLTNVEQNNIFRVLTVVSVIGIPPTLVASMYGMNFKNMPELEWTYGYEWGLALIAISALIPIIGSKGAAAAGGDGPVIAIFSGVANSETCVFAGFVPSPIMCLKSQRQARSHIGLRPYSEPSKVAEF